MLEYNVSTYASEENPEPDWSVAMFWEDITAVFLKLLELIRSLAGYFE